MAVPCPGCGRDYDVALFSFGRTIDCTCGARVGLTPRVRSAVPPGELRFAADAMLGRLARWLRAMGYDTWYDGAVEDAALVRLALEQDRVLLTRDRRLPQQWRVPDERLLVLRAERWHEQLAELAQRFRLDWRRRAFTRCTRCNAPLRDADPAAVAGRVPPRIATLHPRFRECPACSAVYWEGSHTRRMRRLLAEIVPD